MKKSMLKILAFTICCIMTSCGGSGKATKTDAKKNEMYGSAKGYATIYDNDKALARDRATDDAMNRLVKKKLGTTVSGRAIVQDYALIESIVEASSTGMVRNHKITDEGADGNSYFVVLEGEVYPQAVNDTIQATLENYGRPKFMVLIKETFEGKLNMPGFTVTELTMMNIMGNTGFEFVDAATTQMLLKKERTKMNQAIRGRVGGDVQDLLLDDIGAEVVIVGTATTRDQSGALKRISPNLNMKSKSAIINLKAIDVYTGRILASVSADAPGAHINNDTASKKAIEKCLGQSKVLGSYDDLSDKFVTGKFINQITRKFLRAATRRMIMLTITGLNYKDLTKFRNALKGRVRGISKVYSRASRGKAAKLEVQFAGKTSDLADELNAKAENFGFSIEVKETYPNKIMLNITRNK